MKSELRIVWISVGLLAAIVILLVAVYEPEPDNLETVALETKNASPFAEDVEVNDEELKVDLAVLPTDSNESVGQSSSNPEPKSESVVSPESVASDGPVTGDEIPATASNPVVSSNENTKISLNKQEQSQSIVKEVTNNPQASISKTSAVSRTPSISKPDVIAEKIDSEQSPGNHNVKKPGLAMIMLEKEKNRNKVAVIVHESNPQKLTEKEIKAFYLDRLTRWEDGSRVMLYNLPLGDRFRDKFSKSVLKMTALEADKEESKRRELHIKANDVEVKSKNVIVSYVEQHPNAVAYVPLNLVRDHSSVKIVFTIP